MYFEFKHLNIFYLNKCIILSLEYIFELNIMSSSKTISLALTGNGKDREYFDSTIHFDKSFDGSNTTNEF